MSKQKGGYVKIADTNSPAKKDLIVMVARKGGTITDVTIFSEDRTFDRAWRNVAIHLGKDEIEALREALS